VLPVADWANHPTISADGSRVAFDQYRSTIPEARKLGEIRVVVADAATGALTEASHASGVVPNKPVSAYHSAMSADGRSVVFETSAGNMNYAKRYGNMSVVMRDLAKERTARLSEPFETGRALPPRTAYNPTVSGDGRVVAFEAADASPALWLTDRRTGRSDVVSRANTGATYEPRLSADGRVLVYSAADERTAGHAAIYARDVRTGRTTLVGGRRGDAYEPAVSADGRFIAFTSTAGGRSRIWVRDLRDRKTGVVAESTPGFAFDPAISADGRYVAFASRATSPAGRPRYDRASIWLHDRETRRTVAVTTGGGFASEPAVSKDGRRVAFTSTAGDLDPGKPAGITGVFVRDVGAGTTRLLSTHAERKVPPVQRDKPPPSVPASGWWICRLHDGRGADAR
jgi:Tol biopolymer transport system component